MKIRFSLAFLVASLLALPLRAQSTIHQSTARTFHSTTGTQTIVRDSAGNLYVVYRGQFGATGRPTNDLRIGRSTDGGTTWQMNWQQDFVNGAATDVGALRCSLAIDSQNNLHVAWLYQVPNQSRPPRTCHYNRYDAGTNSWGTEVALTTNAVFERPEPVLAVDGSDYVWMFHGTTGWTGTLLRSDQPSAANMQFSPASPNWTATGNAQNIALRCDALGRIHITYYSTSNGATVHHNWMDPAASSPAWSAGTPLGNGNGLAADYYSAIRADALGNVYAVYGTDVQGGKTQDPEFFVRKWDGSTQTWGTAVSFYKTTRAVYNTTTGENDGRLFNLAVDETTGEVYILHRNLESGELVVLRWQDGDVMPTTYAKIANTGTLPANSRNYFIFPKMRGSLYPAFNTTAAGLDIVFTAGDQNAASPLYSLVYDSFPVASLDSVSLPRIGTNYAMGLTAVKDAGKSYSLASSLSGSAPGLPIDRRFVPVVPDNLFFLTVQNLAPTIFRQYVGVLSASGTAAATFAIPNIGALVGVKVTTAFVTYPGGPAGVNSISNPHHLTITS